MGSARALDCFCGAGGLSLGFKEAGFRIVYAFDNDEASVKTYNRNIGSHAEVKHAKDVTRQSIEDSIGESVEGLEVIVGGPPCQGFSVQRRGPDDDERNLLVIDFMRLVLEVQPRFFVMENVRGLLSKRGLRYFETLRDNCQKRGYYLHVAKLNALDYGVPQIRRRVFIVGELVRGGLCKFSFPSGNSSQKEIHSVRHAIFDLINKTEKDVANHKADKLSQLNLKRIRSIRQGQGRDSLPLELQLPTHKRNIEHRHLDVYGRMSWDAPSPTITARFDSFSRGRFGHPELDRTITLREGARLQGFPDSFVFEGTKVEIARQIGNAVPPPIANAIANRIIFSLGVF